MQLRLSLRLLSYLLILFVSSPASAQFTRENAARQKIDEAINQHYLTTDFDKAEGILLGTIQACEDKCSPQTLARAWMYIGIVRGSGRNDQTGAGEAFTKAVALDPNVQLDAPLATDETKQTFERISGSPPAEMPPPVEEPVEEPGVESAGTMECTPEIRNVQTRRAIPVSCTTSEPAVGAELRYKEFGSETWQTLKMEIHGDEFRAEIPCTATRLVGTLSMYVRALDVDGDEVDSFGSKSNPVEFNVANEAGAEPPSYPGEAPPIRCEEDIECPPDFPGCDDEEGDKAEGESCSSSSECKPGLSCQGGTCSAGEADAYRKNWVGLHVAQDFAVVGGVDVCKFEGADSNKFACFNEGTQTHFVGNPYPGSNIDTGIVVATTRLLLSYDRAFGPNFTIGARLGFAFRGGPPAGTDQAPAPFLPFHGEGRITYWIGKNALGNTFRPYVSLGGGMAQVDAKLTITVRDCDQISLDPNLSEQQKAALFADCQVGNGAAPPQGTNVDAWAKLGRGFAMGAVGAVVQLSPLIGIQANVNGMYLFSSSGPNIQPSLGAVIGF